MIKMASFPIIITSEGQVDRLRQKELEDALSLSMIEVARAQVCFPYCVFEL